MRPDTHGTSDADWQRCRRHNGQACRPCMNSHTAYTRWLRLTDKFKWTARRVYTEDGLRDALRSPEVFWWDR